MVRWQVLTTGLALSWLAAGCLSELAEPLQCPPDARVPAGDCESIVAPLTGCLPPQDHACFAGPRNTCACEEEACPPPAAACFPAGDCPSAVNAIAGESATCGRIDEDNVGDLGLIGAGDICTCGCVRCLEVCDGKGPTFGSALRGNGRLDAEDFMFPLVRFDGVLPEAGRLGVYVRMRSLTVNTLQIYSGDPAEGGEALEVVGTALLPSSSDVFTEHVLYEEILDDAGGTSPITWSSAESKPTLLTLLPPLSSPGHTLVEIDCIVPFWVE